MKKIGLLTVLVVVGTMTLAPSAGAATTPASPGFTVPTFSSFTADAFIDDAPGQRDLTAQATKLDGSGFYVAWKWDVTSLSGGNTGDGCALFDTADVGDNANYALCVTIGKNPAVWQSTRIYTCGNGKNDRCTSTYTEPASFASRCAVTNPVTGQFDAADTQATCKVSVADFPGVADPSGFLNSCSYPSREPTSAPADCVLIPGQRETGAIEISKVGPDARCSDATPPTDCVNGTRPLAGAVFSVTGTDVPSGNTGLTTGSDGKVCFAGLPTGASYTVTETAAPLDYGIGDQDSGTPGLQDSQSVTVSSSGTCDSGATKAGVTFTDTPVSSFDVIFHSAAGGATESQIVCNQPPPGGGGPATEAVADDEDLGADDLGTPNRDDTSETFSGLPAGVYTCQIDIAP